jgi:predicted DNA-binding transcriptional regulator AlpA
MRKPKPINLPPRMLRTKEAATFLGVSRRTLEKHRTYGTGPTYRKIGGRVVYTVDDLLAWSADGVRTSTTEKTGTRVFPARRLTPAERQDI